jgi:4-amino-4-deoxy-L-arabinose transferase-like glycosyltransferase
MTYAAVDKILTPWLKRHGLHVYTMHREDEVRAIDVVDDTGERYGIAISPPDESGKVRVFAWNYKRRRQSKRKEYESTLRDLEWMLEEAYAQIVEWVSQEGHTRTPVL